MRLNKAQKRPDIFKAQNITALAALCLIAICLQIQISLFSTEDYLGLRINLADLLLPFAGIGILASLFLKKSHWPRWRMRAGYYWLTGLTLIMMLALLNGYFHTQEWSRWALINKGLGWFILMAYCLLGAWIITNMRPEYIKIMLRTLIGMAFIITIAGSIFILLQDFGLLSRKDALFRAPLDGFMGNRNAYIFFHLILIALIGSFELKNIKLLPLPLTCLAFALLPLTLIHAGSRAGMATALILLMMIGALNGRLFIKTILPAVLAGLLLIGALYHDKPDKIFRENQTTKTLAAYMQINNGQTENDITKISLSERIRFMTLKDSLSLWQNAPLIGIGLGTYLHEQQKKYGEVIEIIDTTPLWLLTETGIIGLLVFAGFYIICLHKLFLRARDSDFYAALCQGMILALIIFGLMSLFHELLYSRQLWFLMGLALALPQIDRRNETV